MNVRINDLDDLEKFINSDSISKQDKFNVFEQALKELPTFCFKIILDQSEVGTPAFDPNDRMVQSMNDIIAEIRADPAKMQYSGLMVIASE